MKRIREHLSKELILLFMLSLFALAPLASPGYFFDAHDADHSVFYLIEFDAGIQDGVVWPRWSPDHAYGYGYPFWIIYAPLAYFVAEGFHLLGLGFTAALKAGWALGFLLGGWGMFALLRRWWGTSAAGRAAALVGGLVYVYAPYHLLTIYVRAAYAEFFAFAWFPWVVLAFDRLFTPSPALPLRGGGSPEAPSPSEGEGRGGGGSSLRAIALAALAYGALLLTHSGTILVFTPLLAAYLLFALVRYARQLSRNSQPAPRHASPRHELLRVFLRVVAAGMLGIGLAAIFLLPLLAEQRYLAQEPWSHGTYNVVRHFVYPSQFVDPFWGYGYSDDPTGPNDGMSFQLGIVAVSLAIAAAAVGLRRRAAQRDTTAFFLLALLATLVLMTPLARPLWTAFSPAAIIQFPWRLLSVAVFCLAILAGGAVGVLLTAIQPRRVSKSEVLHQQVAASHLTSSESAIHHSSIIDHRSQSPIAYVLALVVVLASFPFTLPQYTAIEPIDESVQSINRFETAFPDMIGMMADTQQMPSGSPLVEQYRAGLPLQRAALQTGSGAVETTRAGSHTVMAQVNLDQPSTVLFYTYDFPGWQASIDGQPVAHGSQPPYGLITVEAPAGAHEVSITFGMTPVRTAGVAISLASLLIVIVLLVLSLRAPSKSGKSANRQIGA